MSQPCQYMQDTTRTIAHSAKVEPKSREKGRQTNFSKETDEEIENLKSKGPMGSMYGIFTYIKFIFIVNVDKYTIYWLYGNGNVSFKWNPWHQA